jgi:hypothetical protein
MRLYFLLCTSDNVPSLDLEFAIEFAGEGLREGVSEGLRGCPPTGIGGGAPSYAPFIGP